MLTDAQIERYSRQILLKEVGGKGQEKLLNGRVLIIGADGLGSPIALYLAAAGVGTIGIADADVVDISNLQRQVVHFTADVGRTKVVSAQEKMEALNPDIQVITYSERIQAANIMSIIHDYDFVIDGTDNFAAKFIINDACVLAVKPYSHGGILRFDGQTITVKPGESACYRCIFPNPPPQDAVPTCGTQYLS
jgi:molybdopterin/thiamine biosynthesis adenylyltransferase